MEPDTQKQPDLWSQISLPQWMMENLNNLQQPSVCFDSDWAQDQQQSPSIFVKSTSNHKIDDQNNHQANSFKRKNPLSYEISPKKWSYEQFRELDSLSNSQEDQNQNEEQKMEEGCQSINSLPKDSVTYQKKMRCRNSRKYRQKKKEYVKTLEQQNRFLKFKIDELSFRIRQLQTQINKMKNSTDQSYKIENFHKVKSECLMELEKLLDDNKHASEQELLEIEKRIFSVHSFDGKQKLDLLNYFMSELMENVMSDRVFYFLDGLINKRGIMRIDQSVPYRRIDIQVYEILGLNESKRLQMVQRKQNEPLLLQAKRFQQLWKKLYQVYLAILSQGFKLQRIIQPLKTELRTQVKLENFLRLELHFEKNKFRPDIRQMRNLWFLELSRENENKTGHDGYEKKRSGTGVSSNKRVKSSSLL